jgi:glutaredoxin
VDELYQAEWCPFSRRVRQRFTELGVSFIARPVPAERADREELRRRTGTDEIPALVLENGSAVTGDADEIIAYLDQRYRERSDAPQHHELAREHLEPCLDLPHDPENETSKSRCRCRPVAGSNADTGNAHIARPSTIIRSSAAKTANAA